MAKPTPIPIPKVLIHGGAGSRQPTHSQLVCLTEALVKGHKCLKSGNSSLDALETMIRYLEESGQFNAGRGSLRQLDGIQRMDASIMDGQTLSAGGVAGLEGYLHPICAARRIMTDTDHVLIVGPHAKRLARHFGLARLVHLKSSTPLRNKRSSRNTINPKSQALYRQLGLYDTVGAVALDCAGHLAAGASTGGVAVMLPGRVGDTPLIGAGVYADDTAGAISMTGLGESIIRAGMAKYLAILLGLGWTPAKATNYALKALVSRIQGEAGCLILDRTGRFAIRHTTPWMSAGYWNGCGKPVVKNRFP
ncbi:isoaspartyl peptidase/L-asparaginase family protein [Nitrospira sp. T9]|uniref:isoaspartyl peptidase/L-asparaginase family protein n=1 Tax=unclassified Nitrospira TaxID=2652172 RepID=UPI003F95CA0E